MSAYMSGSTPEDRMMRAAVYHFACVKEAENGARWGSGVRPPAFHTAAVKTTNPTLTRRVWFVNKGILR